MSDDGSGRSSATSGIVTVGWVLVGIGSVVISIAAVDERQFTGAGFCWVAAALVCG